MENDLPIIEPFKSDKEKYLCEDIIIICNPYLMRVIKEIDSLKYIPSQSLEFYFRYDVHLDKSFSIIGPAIGAPASILLLEKAIILGGRRFYVFGTCGALKKIVPIGSIIIPQEAIIDEGTSRNYLPNLTFSFPSQKLLGKIEKYCQSSMIEYSKGKIWTTDAPYQETVSKVKKYQDQLVLAVEMENSALFTVAKYRSVDLASVLVVSDELYDYKWITGYASPIYRETLKKTLGFIVYIIQS